MNTTISLMKLTGLSSFYPFSICVKTVLVGRLRWYNFEHRHSGIRYVSPAQRHAGDDRAILAARHALYTRARELNPARWSGTTRNGSPIGPVTLNPERDCIVNAHSEYNIQQLAA